MGLGFSLVGQSRRLRWVGWRKDVWGFWETKDILPGDLRQVSPLPRVSFDVYLLHPPTSQVLYFFSLFYPLSRPDVPHPSKREL